MGKKELISEITRIQRQTSELFLKQAVESWRELEVPLVQLKYLFIIASKGETTSQALAQDLGVTPGNVTGIIERLVEQGLVSRESNPEDRRIIRLKATAKGRDLLINLRESQTGYMRETLDRMDLTDLDSLLKGLHGFVRALSEQPEPKS